MSLLLLNNHRVYRAIYDMDFNVVARRHVGPAAYEGLKPTQNGALDRPLGSGMEPMQTGQLSK